MATAVLMLLGGKTRSGGPRTPGPEDFFVLIIIATILVAALYGIFSGRI